MDSHSHTDTSAPLNLSKWKVVPPALMVIGGALAVLGFFINRQQFAYSWLLAFMFFLSFGVGAWFLVMVHHLFDASWSVPIRRFLEHMANLLPWMALLFIPIAFLAKTLYPWMSADPHADHALHSKLPLFTVPMFYVVAVVCFVIWYWIPNRLRYWSLKQDQTGDVTCTYRMRFWACLGVFLFAPSVTIAAIMWMKALHHQWFSTMYGVYYFAGSVWTTLATSYLIALVLKRTGHLKDVVTSNTFYFLGSLLFAFTVFYAYIHFSQYFIIWNANIPEETFFYVLREKGTWWQVGLIILFGHFFLPFLAMLRIDVKLSWLMIPIGIWAWLMHYVDMAFNIMPVLHPENYVLHWIDIACLLFMGGLLAKLFVAKFVAHPPYPQKDPRLGETLGIIHLPPATAPTTKTMGDVK